jgi:aldehyde:ferredoxin oxidoreductase
VYANKRASPRGHDHRGRWAELFDTCLSNTGTIETTWGGIHPQLADLPEVTDPFSHEEVSTLNAQFNEIRQFDDCLGTCRIACPNPKLVLECLNAVTGWNWTLDDAFTVGRRVVHLLRVFNIAHGLQAEDERPSKRYGSVPVGGPAREKDITAEWPSMVANYYRRMGWDEENGPAPPADAGRAGFGGICRRSSGKMIRVQVELWMWMGDELGEGFRSSSDMRSILEVDAEDSTTVRDLFADLADRYPSIDEKVFDR